MTEKVFVENKDKSRLEVERILREAFRCDILFLPWDRQEYLGHSDGIVHYAGDGRVLLTNYDDFSPYFYRRFRKALETRFEVIPLLEELACKQSVPFYFCSFRKKDSSISEKSCTFAIGNQINSSILKNILFIVGSLREGYFRRQLSLEACLQREPIRKGHLQCINTFIS